MGGVAGYANLYADIDRCYNTADVWMEPEYHDSFGRSADLGGVAGFSNAGITDCYNLGDVGIEDVSGSNKAYYTMACGGIVGQFVATGGGTHEASRCYNAGSVVSRSRYSGYAGGIVGDAEPNGYQLKVQDCVVVGLDTLAGLGDETEIGACYVPILGSMGGVEFQSSYIGNGISASYSSNRYMNTIKSVGYSVLKTNNGSPITENQALKQTIYEDDENWNFTSIWAMDAGHNGGLPYFQWQGDGLLLMDYSSGAAQIYCGATVRDVAVLAASYDANGKMLDVSMARPGLGAGMNTVDLPLEDTGAEIRVFLLRDGTWEPLAAALRQ